MRLIDADGAYQETLFYSNRFRKSVLKIINALPTVDAVEVRHGKWCHLGGDEWCCSECGYVITTEGSWEKPTAKYCEECGAKMDKE